MLTPRAHVSECQSLQFHAVALCGPLGPQLFPVPVRSSIPLLVLATTHKSTLPSSASRNATKFLAQNYAQPSCCTQMQCKVAASLHWSIIVWGGKGQVRASSVGARRIWASYGSRIERSRGKGGDSIELVWCWHVGCYGLVGALWRRLWCDYWASTASVWSAWGQCGVSMGSEGEQRYRAEAARAPWEGPM